MTKTATVTIFRQNSEYTDVQNGLSMYAIFWTQYLVKKNFIFYKYYVLSKMRMCIDEGFFHNIN